MKFSVILFLAVTALAQHARRKPPPPPPPPSSHVVVSLAPSIWEIEHRIAPNEHPTTTSTGSFTFPIKQYGVEWNNYLDIWYWNHNPATYLNISLSHYLTVTFNIKTVGQPTWRYDSAPNNTCVSPAKVRPFFAVSENDVHYNDTGRWWSNPTAFQLDTLPVNANQTITFTIPLTPDSWSDVNGEFGNFNVNTIAQFAATKARVAELGFTFGGGCFFGHGVSVQGGTARFELIDYQYF